MVGETISELEEDVRASYNVSDLKQFEDEEQTRFLDEFYDLDEVSIFFAGITEEQHQKIINKTKKGIKEGVIKFLDKNTPKVDSVYLSDLSDFAYDCTIAEEIGKKVSELSLPDKQHAKNYGIDVCEGYRTFVYQDSLIRFKERFNLETR